MEWSINVLLITVFIQCRNVIGFPSLRCTISAKNSRHFFIQSEVNQTNRDSFAHVFPRFASASWNYFGYWLVHCIAYVLCDWVEWLLWFSLYDTQLKTAVSLSMRKWYQNHSWLLRSRFPALRVSYVCLFRVVIGSLDFLCLLWLARVIALVWVLKYSIENRFKALSFLYAGHYGDTS